MFSLTTREFQLYQCNGCGFIKILPEPSPQEIMNFYPENYYAHQSGDSLEIHPLFIFFNALSDAVLDLSYRKKSKSKKYVKIL